MTWSKHSKKNLACLLQQWQSLALQVAAVVQQLLKSRLNSQSFCQKLVLTKLVSLRPFVKLQVLA